MGVLILASLASGCNNGASPTVPTQTKSSPAANQADTTPLPAYTPYPTYTLYPTRVPIIAPKSASNTILDIPQKLDITVTRVIDGDTLEVEAGDGRKDKIRLLGVDTPEIGAPNKPNVYGNITDTACLDDWGIRAQEFAAANLEGRLVTLVIDGTTFGELFTFGRLLAFVLLDGKDFNRTLLEQGLARAYTEESNSREQEYLDLQLQAQGNQAGLWACKDGTSTLTPTAAIPPTPTPLPTPTSTPSPTATPAPTQTTTSAATPAPTTAPQQTATPTPVTSATSQPTATPTLVPTPTPAATPTPTISPTPVPIAYPNADSLTDSHSSANCHFNADTPPHAYTHTDGHPYTNAKPNTRPNADSGTDGHPN